MKSMDASSAKLLERPYEVSHENVCYICLSLNMRCVWASGVYCGGGEFMSRVLFALAFLLVAAGLAKSQGTADVRYRLRSHVFYNEGLQIEESKFTYGSQISCDRAGEKKELQFARRKIHAPYMCVPIHFLFDTGGTLT
jgi:hypothetical protein